MSRDRSIHPLVVKIRIAQKKTKPPQLSDFTTEKTTLIQYRQIFVLWENVYRSCIRLNFHFIVTVSQFSN